MMWRICTTVLPIAALTCASAIVTAAARGDSSNSDRLALLVGVSHYPNLSGRYQLSGPENDVLRMRELLLTLFGFHEASIVTLSEGTGRRDGQRLPTRANIEREFHCLAERAGPDSQVVVFFAGHGSQQPCNPADSQTEPDGLDEIFLPRDVGRWNDSGVQTTVENALVDNEIGQWLAAIQARGAALWVIFDCCHSGGMSRGFGERERYTPPDDPEGLAIPTEAISAARQRARTGLPREWDATKDGKVGAPAAVPRPAIDTIDTSRMAIFYACQSNEKTIESEFPPGQKDAYGLLTYGLAAALSKAPRQLSYEELARRVHREYVVLGRTGGPTPLVEGGQIHRPVLGGTQELERALLLSEDPKTQVLQVDAGRLHGLTDRSVLAVYRASRENEKDSSTPAQANGYVRVVRAEPARATVEPCTFAGLPTSRRSQLVGGRCRIVERDYGDLRLRVAIDRPEGALDASTEASLRRLGSLLGEITKEPGSLVELTDDLRTASWFVRPDGNDLLLNPADRWRQAASDDSAEMPEFSTRNSFRIPRNATGPEESRELRDALQRIARAENLIHLAADTGSHCDLNESGDELDFALQVHGFGPGGRLDEPLASPIRVRGGDRLQFVVDNRGWQAIDVTLLYVDSRFGITAIFPSPKYNEINRIDAGQKRPLPTVRVNDSTKDYEWLVVIAVAARGQPVSFADLEQPTIPATRSRGRRMPLSDLLDNALYAHGNARSMNREEESPFRLDVIPFIVGGSD